MPASLRQMLMIMTNLCQLLVNSSLSFKEVLNDRTWLVFYKVTIEHLAQVLIAFAALSNVPPSFIYVLEKNPEYPLYFSSTLLRILASL